MYKRQVQGFGYDHNFLIEKRHPTRAELDAVSASHPILIAHASGHMGVVNSAALKQLGIDASTPDPEGGKIGREAGSQKPNGYLEETAFTPVSYTHLDVYKRQALDNRFNRIF